MRQQQFITCVFTTVVTLHPPPPLYENGVLLHEQQGKGQRLLSPLNICTNKFETLSITFKFLKTEKGSFSAK